MCTGNRCEKWVHDKIPVDIFDTVECAGTMLGGKHQTVNIYFLIYRLIAAIVVTFVNMWQLYNFVSNDGFQWFFIFLTHWSFIINLLYIWSSTILTFIVYRVITSQQKIKNLKAGGNASIVKVNDYFTIDMLSIRSLWRFVLFTLNATVSISIFVILLFWLLVYDPNEKLLTISWNTHGTVGGVVLIDFFCSTWQLTYKGVLMPCTIMLSFGIFSIFYHLAGGKNHLGEKYIYAFLDWSKPGIALACALIVLVATGILHVGVVALKNRLLICWLNSRSEDEKAALIQTNDGNQSLSLAANAETGNFDPNERINVVSKEAMDRHKNGKDLENGTDTGVELAETHNGTSAKSVGL